MGLRSGCMIASASASRCQGLTVAQPPSKKMTSNAPAARHSASELRRIPARSPGTPGEGWGGGGVRQVLSFAKNPHPNPPPEYRGREKKAINLFVILIIPSRSKAAQFPDDIPSRSARGETHCE